MRWACKSVLATVVAVALSFSCGSDDSAGGKSTGGKGGKSSGGAGGATTGGTGGAAIGGTGATLGGGGTPSGGTGGSGGVAGAGGVGGTPGCPGVAPPPQSGGMTYYVAPNGSDTNPGTQAAPFQTIQKGVDSVAPGDTVIVMDGTYTGVAGDPIVAMTKGGTATNWVWVRAEHKWAAKLDGKNAASDGFHLGNDIGYVRVEGFDIYGIAIDGSTTGITCYSGGHDSEIVANHIHDIGHVCTNTTNGLSAIFVQQPNVTVEQNVINDIGRFGPGENGCTPANSYWQNHDHGIYADGNSDSSAPGTSGLLVENNVFYNIKRGWAVQLYPGNIANVRILNNTFAFPNPNKDGQIVLDATISDLRIENNIFFQPTTAPLDVEATTLNNVTLSNNLTDAPNMLNVSSTPAGVTLSANITGTDPGLVGANGLDFHISATSPAVDKGKAEVEVPIDIDGCGRPGGSAYDIGADEITP